jgi:hypothetical protein
VSAFSSCAALAGRFQLCCHSSSLWLPVKQQKGFTGHKVPAKPFAIRFYTYGIPTRLLTYGIKSVFSTFPLAQWPFEKTDVSDYSGGTVTGFHRVPFAGYTHIMFRLYTGFIKFRQVVL